MAFFVLQFDRTHLLGRIDLCVISGGIVSTVLRNMEIALSEELTHLHVFCATITNARRMHLPESLAQRNGECPRYSQTNC